MQVTEKINCVNDEVRLDFSFKFISAQTKLTNKVNAIVLHYLQTNEALFDRQGDRDTIMKALQTSVTIFFATHLPLSEKQSLDNFTPQIKGLNTKIVNSVFSNLMQSSMKTFLDMMASLTSTQNLMDFFLIQSMPEALNVYQNLRETYTDEVISQLIS